MALGLNPWQITCVLNINPDHYYYHAQPLSATLVYSDPLAQPDKLQSPQHQESPSHTSYTNNTPNTRNLFLALVVAAVDTKTANHSHPSNKWYNVVANKRNWR